MTIEEIKEVLKKQKEFLNQEYGVKEMGVFGSYVRNQMGKESDVDILVDFSRSIGLLKFVNLENYLSEILDAKIDLVMKDVLKPRIGKNILEEVVYI